MAFIYIIHIRKEGDKVAKEIDFTKFHHCISTMPLFQTLSLEQIHIIQARIQERVFMAGELLHQAGEQSDALYLVQKGQVRIYRLAKSGKEQHIRILEPGDFIGELSLFNNREYEGFVEAIEPTTVCCVKREDFKQILIDNPLIAIELLSELSDRLDDSEQQTTRITSESVQVRLAAYVLEEYHKQHTKCVTLPSTKKNIASYLGMSPETFSRGLSKLTKEGIVKQSAPNIIEILDVKQLKQLRDK